MKSGGVDHVAVISARMKGWKTGLFTERICESPRKIGYCRARTHQEPYRDGALDYALGGNRLGEDVPDGLSDDEAAVPRRRPEPASPATSARRFRRETSSRISDELVAFRRREQMRRLRSMVGGSRRGVEAA